MRHHADHRNACQFFQHFHTGVKDRFIAPEVVDDKALHSCTFIRLQQRYRAVERSEHAAAVDIRTQKHRCAGHLGHTHIDDILLLEVDLSGTARTLKHDDIIFIRQLSVGLHNVRHKLLFIREIVPRSHDPANAAVHNDL